jgi:replicative DNA helicase
MNDIALRTASGGLPGSRTPPHDLGAEKAALGGVLIKPSSFDEMATVLTVDDFYLPAHREVFEAMVELDKRRLPFDPIAIADELKNRGTLSRLQGGEAYLMELAADVPTAENIATYVRIVKEKATLRRLIGECAEISSRAYGEFGNYEEFLDEAEGKIFKVAQQNRKEGFRAVGEMMNEVLENIEVRARDGKEVTGVPTGFKKFDEMTAGLQPENLIIVAARPGMGKTSWAVNVAVNAALHHRIPVLIFSLEMSKYELMERMLAGEARIDSSRMRRGMIEYSDWKNRIYPAGGRLSSAPILIDDGASPSILEIRAKARRFKGDPRYFPPPERHADGREIPRQGLIVIDYLQLARGMGGKKEETREREIADISRGLKGLAKDLKLPIIAISQLNRGLEKREEKTPQLSDLRESGAIEQDADLVLFIHREEMFNPEGEKGKAQIIVGKNRHGATGNVPMTFIKEYTRFEDYAEDDGVPEPY